MKVAEAYARTVLNRRVQATFVKPRKGVLANAEALGIEAAPHAAISAAMRNVIRSEDGTGQWLRQSVDKLAQAAAQHGLMLTAYAKTGTPRVQTESRHDLTAALAGARQEGKISWSRRASTEHGGGWNFYWRKSGS